MKTTRNGQADALKGGAILLVVAGHLIEGMLSSQLNMNVYMAIYSFHMPLFAFLAGLFAKPTVSERDAQNIIKRIVLPFVVFQIAYSLYVKVIPGWTYGLLQPYWLLWFLLSLLYWRVLLPIMRSPIGLLVSAFAALAVGHFPQIGNELGLVRTIYFFPFFIAGSLYGFSIIQAVTDYRKFAWLWFVIAMAAIALWARYGLDPVSLRGSEPYSRVRPLTHEPEAGRALLLLIALMASVGFCAFVPRQSRLLEYFGRNVFSIYLFHGFIIMAFKNYLAYRLPADLTGLPIVLALAAIICLALAPLQKPMERAFDTLYSLICKINLGLTPTNRPQD